MIVRATAATILDRLQQRAQQQPNEVVYKFLGEEENETLTFGQLSSNVRSLAAYLSNSATAGERAVLMYPPGLQFVEAFLACLAAGIVAVPATPPRRNRRADRLQAIIADATPRLLLGTRSTLSLLETTGIGQTNAVSLATDMISRAAVDGQLQHPLDAGAIAYLQYTSGSTAVPRGVAITHRNVMHNQELMQALFCPPAEGRVVGVSWLPMFHDMGLMGNLFQPLYSGILGIIMSPQSFLQKPGRWLQAISDYRANVSGGPNFAYDACVRTVDEIDVRGIDLSSWKVAFNGAEPVRAATLDRFAKCFEPCGFHPETFVPCYGLAEATLMVSGGPGRRAPTRLRLQGSDLDAGRVVEVGRSMTDVRELVGSGRIADDTQVEVVDPATQTRCAPESVGEIWVSSASVAQGYWNNPEETTAVFEARLSNAKEGLFLRTGDLGFVREGELFITGRLKGMLIVRGRNLYAEDLEGATVEALGLDIVLMAVALGINDEDDERAVVVVEVDRNVARSISKEPGEGMRLATSVRVCVAEKFDIPLHEVAIVRPGTIPRTSSGKADRAAIRATYLAKSLDAVFVWQAPGAERASANHGKMTETESQLQPRPDSSSEGSGEASAVRAERMIAWFRSFAERRLDSHMADERRMLPPSVVLELGSQGFFGLQVPGREGGCDLKAGDARRVLEQLAAVDLSVAALVGIHNGLGLHPILRHAAKAWRAETVPRLTAGRQLAAFALTESAAGSNPSALRTTATRERGGWRLTGEKRWIGLASWAAVATVIARALDDDGRSLGLTAFLVDLSSEGVQIGAESRTLGLRAIVQNRISLDKVFVADDRVLGGVGAGMEVALEAMNLSRLGIAALCIGVMKRCAQWIERYASRRHVATGRLLDNAVMLRQLHDLTSAIAAVESLVQTITNHLDSGRELPVELFAVCKTTAPELAFGAADFLMQGLGGRGYEENNGVPRLFRDCRALRIIEGPTEPMLLSLGAACLRNSDVAKRVLEGVFNDAELANEVAAVFDGVRARSASATELVAHNQWACFLAGEVLSLATLLAATRSHQAVAGVAAEDAILWARNRLEAARQRAQGQWPVFDKRSAEQISAIVGQYERDIGNVEQAQAGEETALDELLRRDAVQEQRGETLDAVTADRKDLRPLIRDMIMQRLEEQDLLFGNKTLAYDDPLQSLGIDSLMMVRIGLDLQTLTGRALSPEAMGNLTTINELAEYLENPLNR